MKRLARVLASGLILSCLLSATNIAGLWTGEVAGRGGEKQDISFQFTSKNKTLTGKMFGDEFDIPVQGLLVSGDRITFYITTTNYYDGSQTKFVFAGTVTFKAMQLTREREESAAAVPAAAADKDSKKQDAKQTFTLKRLT